MMDRQKITATEVEEISTVKEAELPRSDVDCIVKDTLYQLSGKPDLTVSKDVLTAFYESTCTFLHHLSATANVICRGSKRKIIHSKDVYRALEEIDFEEIIGPVKASVESFRRINPAKKAESSNAKETLEEHVDETLDA